MMIFFFVPNDRIFHCLNISQNSPNLEYTPHLPKFHNLLSISTTRWHYNQGKCVLAYNSFCRTFKNIISTRSLNCAESRHIGHAHFRLPFFLHKFTKCRKRTFSNSSPAISPIRTKLCTQHLWTHLTSIF